MVTYQSKKPFDTSADVTTLGEYSEDQASRDENEESLEDMGDDFGLLDIRLRNLHVVVFVLFGSQRRVGGKARTADEGAGEKLTRGVTKGARGEMRTGRRLMNWDGGRHNMKKRQKGGVVVLWWWRECRECSLGFAAAEPPLNDLCFSDETQQQKTRDAFSWRSNQSPARG